MPGRVHCSFLSSIEDPLPSVTVLYVYGKVKSFLFFGSYPSTVVGVAGNTIVIGSASLPSIFGAATPLSVADQSML